MRTDNEKRQGYGAVDTIGGRIKQAFARLMGHERIQAEGRAQELRGREEIERGMAAERREGKVEEVGGAVKRGVGEALGNERTEAEGRARELEGRERQVFNR